MKLGVTNWQHFNTCHPPPRCCFLCYHHGSRRWSPPWSCKSMHYTPFHSTDTSNHLAHVHYGLQWPNRLVGYAGHRSSCCSSRQLPSSPAWWSYISRSVGVIRSTTNALLQRFLHACLVIEYYSIFKETHASKLYKGLDPPRFYSVEERRW